MKKQLLLIILLNFIVIRLCGQEYKKYYLGTHFSYGKANYSASRSDFSSSADYSGKDYLTFAIDYGYKTSENVELCIGLNLNRLWVNIQSEYTGHSYSSHFDEYFSIVSVPVGIKYYFGKYFYANAGLSFNYHRYNGYTWGLGGFAGVGAQYTFKSGMSLSIAPQAQVNLLNIGGIENVVNNGSMSVFDDVITQIGFNVGIGYRF